MYPACALVSTWEILTITFRSDGPSWNPPIDVYCSFWDMTLPSNSSLMDVMRKAYICDEF
jgi:hypothetical protein